MTGLGLGVGFLAKGPLVLLWTLPPVLAWAMLEKKTARRPSPAHLLAHPVTWLVFALAGLPWYVGEALRHPGLAGYWLGNQTAERFLTTVHGRAEPWWYFLALLPGVVLPWLPETARGVACAVGRASSDDPGNTPDPAVRRLWVIWALLPVVIFSLSGSKRPNYLLPLVAPLALLAAAALPERRSRGAKVWTGVWGSVTLLLPFVAGALPGVAPPTREVARAARERIASSRSLPVVTYRTLPSSFPFYVGRDVPTVGHGRGAPFDSPETVALWSPRDPDRLGDLLEGCGGIVLVRARDLEEARRHAGRSLDVVAAAGELRLLVARPGEAGDSPP